MSTIGQEHLQVLYDQLPRESRLAYIFWCNSMVSPIVDRSLDDPIEVLLNEWLTMRFNKLVSLLLEKPS